MSDTTSTKDVCRHCGREIKHGQLLEAEAWFADVPFGEGMVVCYPGQRGSRERHEPAGGQP